MNIKLSKWITGVAAIGAVSYFSAYPIWAQEPTSDVNNQSETSFSPYVDAKGGIILPDDFRMKMVHLGSWFVPEGEASGFHDVYTEAASAKVYRETGKFPDGATLVKELRAAKAGAYTTGANVSYAKTDGLKQWFVMIKDTQNRFEGNPHWANGWGWALFKPGQTKKNVSKGFKQDCFGCHIPVKKQDWIYSEAYPTLKQIAKDKK